MDFTAFAGRRHHRGLASGAGHAGDDRLRNALPVVRHGERIEADALVRDPCVDAVVGAFDVDRDGASAGVLRGVGHRLRCGRHQGILRLSEFTITDHDDFDRGEDHYQDFHSVLRFLLRDRAESLDHYDQHRHALYKQLLDLRKGEIDLNVEHRQEVEKLLRSVMCRTERNSVADDPAIMIEDQLRDPVELGLGDIENYRQTDQIVLAMNRLKLHAGKPDEYCNSALNPITNLDRYKVLELLVDIMLDPQMESCSR